jgi:hypothetical protein
VTGVAVVSTGAIEKLVSVHDPTNAVQVARYVNFHLSPG